MTEYEADEVVSAKKIFEICRLISSFIQNISIFYGLITRRRRTIEKLDQTWETLDDNVELKVGKFFKLVVSLEKNFFDISSQSKPP